MSGLCSRDAPNEQRLHEQRLQLPSELAGDSNPAAA
jgi:hypothetical protein